MLFWGKKAKIETPSRHVCYILVYILVYLTNWGEGGRERDREKLRRSNAIVDNFLFAK